MPVLDLGSLVVNGLPPLISYALADAGGAIFYRAWGAKRRAARSNYGVVLDRSATVQATSQLARRSFRAYARMVLDTLRLRTMPVDRLRQWITLEGREHIEEGMARGKGIIAVLPHVGNWEPASNVAALLPFRMLAVVDEGLVSRAVAGSRQRVGIAVVEQSRAARPVIRALRDNFLVLLVADLVKDFRATPVRLFGRETHIPAGPAHLAVRTGAAMMPVVAVRRKDNTSLIRCEPLLFADPTCDPAEEMRRLSQAIAGYFERVIRAHPDQWYPYRPLWTAEDGG